MLEGGERIIENLADLERGLEKVLGRGKGNEEFWLRKEADVIVIRISDRPF